MTTVSSICNKALVLEQGKTIFPLGPIHDAIACYLSEVGQKQQEQFEQGRQDATPGLVKITGFSIRGVDNTILETLTSGFPVNFQIEYLAEQFRLKKDINISILIKNLNGDVIANLNSQTSLGPLTLSAHRGQVICHIEKLPLAPGNIIISLMIEQGDQAVDKIESAFVGTVDRGGHFEGSAQRENQGWLLIDQDWSVH